MNMISYLLTLALVSPVLAQPPGSGMRGGTNESPTRQRIREKVQMVKIWRLTEAVGLTPEQSEKFFPVYNRHQEQMDNFEREKREILERIKGLADNPNSAEDEISAAMRDHKEHHHKLAELHDSFLSDISSILSIRQRGKLVVFEEEFRRDMQRIIAEIRREFKGGPGNRDR